MTVHILLRQFKIPYITTYLDFPDLEPTFSALGIPPNTDPDAHGLYTVPVLSLPPTPPSAEGAYIMDSLAIIHALHARAYLHCSSSSPSSLASSPPTLQHDPTLHATINTHIASLGTALAPFLLPAIAARIPPRSAAWYRAKRAALLPPGVASFEELRATTTLEACLEGATPAVEALEGVVTGVSDGRWREGTEVGFSWEEMVVLALLAFLGRVDGELFEGVVGMVGEGGKLKGLWGEAEEGGFVREVFV